MVEVVPVEALALAEEGVAGCRSAKAKLELHVKMARGRSRWLQELATRLFQVGFPPPLRHATFEDKEGGESGDGRFGSI